MARYLAPDAEAAALKRTSHPRGRAQSPFALLNAEHQHSTVLRLTDSRMSDDAIASITGLDVGVVRRIIAARAAELRAKGESLS
jgi:hypothetical protein